MSTLLSINSYFYRRDGSEVVFLDHNRLYESLGWRVIPFCMHHQNNQDTPWSQYFVNEIEFGNTYSLWEKMIRVPKVIYSLEAQQKLIKLLERVQPDVAHCHTIYHHLSSYFFKMLNIDEDR